MKKNCLKTAGVALALILLSGQGCAKQPNATPATQPASAPTVDTSPAVPAISPSLAVADQDVINNTVTVSTVTASESSWLVIHIDDNGKPEAVIGQVAVKSGENFNVRVAIDTKKATSKLYAMLHTDAGTIGAYEFPGPDTPTKVNERILLAPFSVTLTDPPAPTKDNKLDMPKTEPKPAAKSQTSPTSSKSSSSSQTPAQSQTSTQTTQTQTQLQVQTPSPTPTPPQPQPTQPEPTKTATPSPTPAPQPTVKAFNVVARQWSFEPNTITINKGDTVRLSVKSVDVTHGLAISDFNVNKNLEPGQTTTIEFVADKVGTFSFACSVFCGSGHGGMRGTLIVK